MALLSVLLELRGILQLKISVSHVHHGSLQKKQRAFQNKAFIHTKDFCSKQNLDFYSNIVADLDVSMKPNVPANPNVPTSPAPMVQSKPMQASEAQMRKYRYEIFAQHLKQSKAQHLVLAHTADDLVETRLIRLIRGTGEQGLLSMPFQRGKVLRPMIHIIRMDIQKYVRNNKLEWCEDPSNRSSNYSLRNWIRNEWLPQLEQKRPGAKKSLARSLYLLSQQTKTKQKNVKKNYQSIQTQQGLRRDLLLKLPEQERQKILAHYMNQKGFKNYQSSHIQEILKQLDRPQKQFIFSLLGEKWKVSPFWFSIRKSTK